MIQYKKKLLNMMLFGYGGSMILLIAMLTALMLLDSNVLYQNGTFVKVIDICISVADVFSFAIAVAVVIYGIYLMNVRSLTTVFSAFVCITIFHYVAVLCIGWLIFPGTLPETIGDLMAYFFEEVIVFVFLDCLRLFLIGLITVKLLAKKELLRRDYNRKTLILGEEQLSARNSIYPLKSFISFKNPVQVGALISAAIYWLTFYVQYVYYDIITIIKLDYFEGASLRLFTLAVNAVLACICYCIAIFILMKFDEHLPKQE